jgi:hypothetical protein
MKFYLILLTIGIHLGALAQPTQRVRGKVFDSETNYGLEFAKIILLKSDSIRLGIATTDSLGQFNFDGVIVGKHQLEVYVSSYETKLVTIEVNSGKECIVQIPMSERIIEKEEVIIRARKKGEVLNEMALISAQQFSVEETNRYPGSRMDPARMASNFAGVQGSDDSRNDIIVRGNSPLGVVYRVEGINIPNPSHFAISGSSGGPVSILNNKILGNSDFFMSAFPAEFGNSTSGVFDLKLRNGNNNQHEFTGQFGIFGTEMLAEGPLNKAKTATYLVMGRYSTLSIFQKFGIQIGTDAVPVYGDAAFKLNWLLKKGGQLSLWGMGGKSAINIEISKQTAYSKEFYGEGDRDQKFGTQMGVSGLTYKRSLNEKTFINATLSFSAEEQRSRHIYLHRSLQVNGQDTLIRVDSSYNLMGYSFKTFKTGGYFAVNHKLSKKHLIKAGISLDLFNFNNIDSVLADINIRNQFITRWNYIGSAVMIQPFVQWKYKFSDQMELTAGIHAQYFSQGNRISPIEPRVGWKYKLQNNQAVFAGAGLHSQAQPYYTYSYAKHGGTTEQDMQNYNMAFTKSWHSGIGYEKSFKSNLNFKTEAYYQYLYNIPVTISPTAFSMVNSGSGFSRIFPDTTLVNEGIGYNYGIETTLQKYFDKSFFFLFSGSIYDSKYRGSDLIWRNTSYKGANISDKIDLSYVWNVLIGKEFSIGSKHTIGLGTKLTQAGGRRYGYVDLTQTNKLKEIIFKDSLFNDRVFPNYFRMDLKISWKMNAKNITHEIGLDLVNLLNTRNLLNLAYAPPLDPADHSEPIAEKTQLGFLPIFYYKADFKFGQ